jgi:hypothetical protein
MGNLVSARRNVQVKAWPLKETESRFSPQQAMGRPSGLRKEGPLGGSLDRCGKTEKTAPVSTKKRRFEISSHK